jgi:hypothetical protein
MIRWVGVAFFALSFLTPQIDFGPGGAAVSFKDWGLGAFCMTPVHFVTWFRAASKLGEFLCVILVVAAWLNNFCVFFRFPPSIAWIPILLPWALLIVAAFDLVDLSGLWTYKPFYPWAIGIGFIHAAGYLEPREVVNRRMSGI